MNSQTLGEQFVPTAGRILGHLGDVMAIRFCPAAATQRVGDNGLQAGPAGQRQHQQPGYLLQAESTDIGRLKAEIQSFGYEVHGLARTVASGSCAGCVDAGKALVGVPLQSTRIQSPLHPPPQHSTPCLGPSPLAPIPPI